MFDGLMSRWTTPASCAAASASATWRPTSSACRSESGARRWRAWRSSPSSHSMAMYGEPVVEPAAEPVGAGRLERSEGDDPHDARVVELREHLPLALEARLLGGVDAGRGDDLERDAPRPVTVSSARYTMPAAPRPTSRSMRKRPATSRSMRLPATRRSSRRLEPPKGSAAGSLAMGRRLRRSGLRGPAAADAA